MGNQMILSLFLLENYSLEPYADIVYISSYNIIPLNMLSGIYFLLISLSKISITIHTSF